MPTISKRIQSANLTVKELATSFASAVSHSELRNADFASVFEVRVDDSIHNAKTSFVNERQRVEQEVTDQQKDLQNTHDHIDELCRRIRTIDNNISNLNQNIRIAQNRVDDFRRQANRANCDTVREELMSRVRIEERNRDNFTALRSTSNRTRETTLGQINKANDNLSNLRSSIRTYERRLRDIEQIISLF